MATKPKQTEPDEEAPPFGYGDLAQWAEIFEPSPEAAMVGAMGYAEKVLVPRALAEARRKAGDPSASPRDYDCGCPISVTDKRPRCFGLRDCKFRDRYEAEPRSVADPVRRQTYRAQYHKLKAELLAMPPAQSFERIQQIIEWYHREVYVKGRGDS